MNKFKGNGILRNRSKTKKIRPNSVYIKRRVVRPPNVDEMDGIDVKPFKRECMRFKNPFRHKSMVKTRKRVKPKNPELSYLYEDNEVLTMKREYEGLNLTSEYMKEKLRGEKKREDDYRSLFKIRKPAKGNKRVIDWKNIKDS